MAPTSFHLKAKRLHIPYQCDELVGFNMFIVHDLKELETEVLLIMIEGYQRNIDKRKKLRLTFLEH